MLHDLIVHVVGEDLLILSLPFRLGAEPFVLDVCGKTARKFLLPVDLLLLLMRDFFMSLLNDLSSSVVAR